MLRGTRRKVHQGLANLFLRPESDLFRKSVVTHQTARAHLRTCPRQPDTATRLARSVAHPHGGRPYAPIRSTISQRDAARHAARRQPGKHHIPRSKIEFVALADEPAESLPRGRAYPTDQLRRVCTSVALNIAEGAGEFSFARTSWRNGGTRTIFGVRAIAPSPKFERRGSCHPANEERTR